MRVDTGKALAAELEALEQDSRDQVRRLVALRRQRSRELDRLLHGLATVPPAGWTAAVGASEVRDSGRRLGGEIARALIREDRRQRRLPGFDRGTGWNRTLNNYRTGAWLGGIVGGGDERSRQWGGLGGVLGSMVGGPIGGVVGSVLGGLFGRGSRRRREEARKWLNTPEGFEIQAYLYNLYRRNRPYLGQPGTSIIGAATAAVQVMVQRGAVQITGGDSASGVQAANALISQLGRAVTLATAASAAAG